MSTNKGDTSFDFEWFIDSIASNHFTKNKSLYHYAFTPLRIKTSVSIANNHQLSIIRKEVVHLNNKLTKNVLYVFGIDKNLLVASKIINDSHLEILDSYSCIIINKKNSSNI